MKYKKIKNFIYEINDYESFIEVYLLYLRKKIEYIVNFNF